MRALSSILHRVLEGLGALALAVSLASCEAPVTPQRATSTVSLPIAPPTGAPYEPGANFAQFIASFRVQAHAAGITDATYDAALGHVAFNPRVWQLNGAQPEFVRPIWDYLDTAVSPRRIADGQAMLAANAATLTQIEQRYGVPKEILVAIWGMESDYGRSMGSFNLFEALATLAFDGPRVDYARPELIAALKMVQNDGFKPDMMKSSWAGAFGQTQFVPTAYFAHAVDFDADGKKDLWNSAADALGSTASLLAGVGWKSGAQWGYEVRLPANFPYEQADVDSTKQIADWRALGVKTALGADLPDSPEAGAIILPAGARGPAFLVFGNFKAVLKYNNAVSYALGICELALRIGGANGIVAPWPRDEVPLGKNERLQMQRDLLVLGYDPGAVDGVLGRKVRAALRLYQQARNIPVDGFATKALLDRMNAEIKSKTS
ncbi:MAG TPA: lytic murein transglycosylase [Rhizomicrobium sp.]|jgi:membrane-bound lytic murein transglycosylase B|nr:lytic murein transglycosylase [Rhizomicrobium sp.]